LRWHFGAQNGASGGHILMAFCDVILRILEPSNHQKYLWDDILVLSKVPLKWHILNF